tara:strand:+ start:692 stop:913 length:222 start_codon:yes stop_codon:yes gene_type:complete
MTEQISREEQIKRTRERIYRVHGLTNGGITGTLKSIYYLTFGYFTNYERHLIYVDTLKFVMEKQKEEREEQNE